MSNKNDYVKLICKGWQEANDKDDSYTNIPKRCPKCNGELMKTDALSLCNMLWVGCRNLDCRWAEVYYIEE